VTAAKAQPGPARERVSREARGGFADWTADLQGLVHRHVWLPTLIE
jgi:hypothetical protein